MRESGVFTYLITILAILVVLLVPMPIGEDYRIFEIALLLFVFMAVVLSRFSDRLGDCEFEQKKIEEKFKIYDRLSKIEAKIGMQND